jgi:hypothetical protein
MRKRLDWLGATPFARRKGPMLIVAFVVAIAAALLVGKIIKWASGQP